MTTRKRLQQLAALALLLVSGGLLAWGFWPFDASSQALGLKPEQLFLPSPESGITPTPNSVPGSVSPTQPFSETAVPTAAPPALQEQRQLVLEFPAVIRQGDSATVRLTLRLNADGTLTPAATMAGVEVTSEPFQVPNIYDTHRVFAQARLDLAGIESVPAVGQIQLTPLLPGEEVTFYWSIRSKEIASYSGVVWFSLRYEPLDGGPPVSQVISAQPVEIECVNFAGLGGTPARLMGGAGILLGVLLSRDTVVDFFRKFRNSRKPRSKSSTASKKSTRKPRGR